jgi:hypothetical protein
MPTQRPLDEACGTLRLPKTIRGLLLRDFAASSATRRMSVIVQAHLPAFNADRPSLDLAAARSATAALKVDLKDLGLLERARKVSDYSGFVLEVTPRQLRLLGQAASVQAIRPNLRRRYLHNSMNGARVTK